MKKENVVAKKKFGQNFLKDESVLRKIVEAMPKNDNKIVEIGPGLGDLTKFLVDVKSVEAFEVDTDLCKLLQSEFKEDKMIGIDPVLGDIIVEKDEYAIIRGGWADRAGIWYDENVDSEGLKSINVIFNGITEKK